MTTGVEQLTLRDASVERDHASRRRNLLLLPGLIVAATLLVLPFGGLVYYSLVSESGWSLQEYANALTAGSSFIKVIVRTVLISATVAGLTLLLGYPLAYLAHRLRKPWSTILLVCVVLPFFTSTLIRTYGWRIILADNGVINEFLLRWNIVERPVQLLFNDIGVVIGFTQVLLPFMVFPLYSVMRRIDRSLQLAAQSMGATPFTAWRSVFLPLTTGGIFSGLALVFVTSLGFYVTPVMLQGPTTPMLAQRFASLFILPGQRATVAAEAVLVMVMVVFIMFAFKNQLGLVFDTPDSNRDQRRSRRLPGLGERMRSFRGRGVGRSDEIERHSETERDRETGVRSRIADRVASLLSQVRYPGIAIISLIAVVILLFPLLVVGAVAFSDSSFLEYPPPAYSLRWFEAYLQDSEWLSSTALSLTVAGLAAAAATVAGGLAAYAIARSRTRRLPTFSYFLLVAPLAIPEIVLAAALLFASVAVDLRDTATALVLAYTLLGIPVVVIILTAIFQNLDPIYERAALSLGAPPRTVARTVIVPLVLPAVVSAALFAFLKGFDDLAMAQFLGGARTVTLVRRMFADIRFEISPQIAAVGMLLLTATIVLLLLVRFANRRRGEEIPLGIAPPA